MKVNVVKIEGEKGRFLGYFYYDFHFRILPIERCVSIGT